MTAKGIIHRDNRCFGRSDLACMLAYGCTYVLTCLPNAERNYRGRIYLFARTTDRIHGRADIFFLTLSLEAHKESRQKRLVEHRENNSKTAILQYFIDRAANRLLSPGGTNLDSLSSRKHKTPAWARPFSLYLFL